MMAEIREFFVDCPDVFDVIEFDLLKILFFIKLNLVDYFLVQLPIGLGGGHFFPVFQVESIRLFIT